MCESDGSTLGQMYPLTVAGKAVPVHLAAHLQWAARSDAAGLKKEVGVMTYDPS